MQSPIVQSPVAYSIAMQADDEIDNASGEPPITESSVHRDMMLRRRAQVELKVGTSVPVGLFEDNEFEPGIFLGAKATVEGAKNIFFGLSFDYSRNTVDQGVSALVNDPSSLPGVTPDQLYDSINRYNTLITFDHDVVLMEDTIGENSPSPSAGAPASASASSTAMRIPTWASRSSPTRASSSARRSACAGRSTMAGSSSWTRASTSSFRTRSGRSRGTRRQRHDRRRHRLQRDQHSGRLRLRVLTFAGRIRL
jgi:hypothetical protein